MKAVQTTEKGFNPGARYARSETNADSVGLWEGVGSSCLSVSLSILQRLVILYYFKSVNSRDLRLLHCNIKADF